MPVPPCGNYGDVSGDGNVSSTDMMYIAQYLEGTRTLTPDQLDRADVNGDGKVTQEDIDLIASYVVGAITTFPVCGVAPPPTAITCSGPTPHFSSGCALLVHYGAIGGGIYEDLDHSIISRDERDRARRDQENGLLTVEERDFVIAACTAGSINALCPGCYTGTTPPPPVICTPGETRCYGDAFVETCIPDGTGWTRSVCYSGTICEDGECVPVSTPPPPNMETRTMALTEGTHTIQIALSGYDTLNATINVSSTGVTCVSVIGGACGGTGLPRVSTSGWTVTTYLKSGAVTTNRCTWIATQDTSRVVFISEMVLAYNNLANIGFTPTAAEIGNAVLMYSNLGTPASLWGC